MPEFSLTLSERAAGPQITGPATSAGLARKAMNCNLIEATQTSRSPRGPEICILLWFSNAGELSLHPHSI